MELSSEHNKHEEGGWFLLKTKSLYDSKEYGDGTRILISRLYPRGIKKEHFHNWQKDLSPSLMLIHKYKNDEITWQRFFSEFKLELRKNQKSIAIIEQIHRKSKNSHVTLLCFEPNGETMSSTSVTRNHSKSKIVKNRFYSKVSGLS